MNREEIKNLIPHREPMLLVDNIEFDGTEVEATYHVRGDEYFLQGHYPGNPIVPGVIQCEIMAQASCRLVEKDLPGKTPLYAGLDKIRFKRPVRPGETIVVHSRVKSQRMHTYFIEAEATVDGEVCVKGELIISLIPNN